MIRKWQSFVCMLLAGCGVVACAGNSASSVLDAGAPASFTLAPGGGSSEKQKYLDSILQSLNETQQGRMSLQQLQGRKISVSYDEECFRLGWSVWDETVQFCLRDLRTKPLVTILPIVAHEFEHLYQKQLWNGAVLVSDGVSPLAAVSEWPVEIAFRTFRFQVPDFA